MQALPISCISRSKKHWKNLFISTMSWLGPYLKYCIFFWALLCKMDSDKLHFKSPIEMMKDLETKYYVERIQDLNYILSTESREYWEDMIAVFRYLKDCHIEDRLKLFGALGGRTRVTMSKLQGRKLKLNVRRNFLLVKLSNNSFHIKW